MNWPLVESCAHSALALCGFVLVIVRLRVLAGPKPSLYCRSRWWAWVGAHALFAIGLFAVATRPLYGMVEPRASEWAIRTGLVIYLLLKIGQKPMRSDTRGRK